MIKDPRRSRGFRSDLLPKLNGSPAPAAGWGDAILNRQLEFVFLYYFLNLSYRRLLEARKAGRAEAPSLRAIEKLLIERDRLEDAGAPFGIFAEPILEDGFTVNLFFCTPPVSDRIQFSAWVSIPLPKGQKRRVTKN